MRIEFIYPTKDRLIIKKFKEEVKTAGGIILQVEDDLLLKDDRGNTQDPIEDNTYYAEVISSGPDCKAKKGHVVLITKYAGIDLHKSFPGLKMIKQDDILAYIADQSNTK